MLKRISIFVLLSAVILSLTACSLKGSQSTNENSPQNSANPVDEKTDELSLRLKQYKSFLKDEVSSEDGLEGARYLRNFCNIVVPEETEDGIRYALFDMTGDELPELHVLTDISYSIHTIESNQLITWYTGDRYNRPLNNRAILQKVESTGITYSYIVLDSKGQEVLCIGFGDPQGMSGAKYFFDTGNGDIELSKGEWDKLTRPFLSIGSDEIIWKNINDLDYLDGYTEAMKTQPESKNVEWQQCYTAFLEEELKNKDKEDVLEFAIRDLDNNKIPEIIIAQNGVDISVYTFDSDNSEIYEAGSCNYGGTTQLFFSNDLSYPGIFYFHVGGGLEHHGYMTIKENSLVEEELWNYDYSGVSEELGEKREKTLEISSDKQLIDESKEVYSQNQQLLFEELDLENIEYEIKEN